MDVFIEVDARRRVSLGRLGHHERYLAHEEEDGTIILRPAVVLTELEARMHTNHPQLAAQLAEDWEHRDQRRVERPRRPAERRAS